MTDASRFRFALRVGLVAVVLAVVSVPFVAFGLVTNLASQPLENAEVVGVWRSEENGGTLSLREDGSAEVSAVVDHRLRFPSEDIISVLISHDVGTWYVSGLAMNEVTVLLGEEHDGVSSLTLFAQRSLSGDLHLQTVANVDVSGGEQSFKKE